MGPTSLNRIHELLVLIMYLIVLAQDINCYNNSESSRYVRTITSNISNSPGMSSMNDDASNYIQPEPTYGLNNLDSSSAVNVSSGNVSSTNINDLFRQSTSDDGLIPPAWLFFLIGFFIIFPSITISIYWFYLNKQLKEKQGYIQPWSAFPCCCRKETIVYPLPEAKKDDDDEDEVTSWTAIEESEFEEQIRRGCSPEIQSPNKESISVAHIHNSVDRVDQVVVKINNMHCEFNQNSDANSSNTSSKSVPPQSTLGM